VDSGRLSTKWQSQRPDAAFRIRASICQERGGSVCGAFIVIAAELTATTAADAADTFRKLTASEIKSKVSGMEIEDVGEHWAEQYMRNGSLKVSH
jgi:hypothetical protein